MFGRGTQLNVESGEEFLPSYYKLSDGNTTACLATGFSRYNATEKHETYGSNFSKTEAVRISEDSLYNSVILFVKAEDGDKCEEDTKGETGSVQCGDILEPGVTVNTVSLTILCLRLLFLKTVVFNVLMTLRLWISQ
ncbi:M1-specific T cell receptor alpha chain-like [Toxotes jaculatrix]|uniref:M1-specific T cell receptor alpha chain-like n=1 Tax=Toxotes jaculatrix TaxID=941984 RepID=UPI001B3AF7B5|nr:M1-specific T cell receptor alpha chain-like [Toxotes jaculatrix]